MEISCAFPTALDSPDHIVLAEELGYDRAWLYDTPQQSTDVWVTLALAAERTERIGLGPGVLVPSLRHPMVNAAATANLAALAPGPRRRRVRDGVHRPPRDGLSRDPVEVHGRLHPRLPRPAARRDDRVGGRADADAAPARPRRRPRRSTCRSSSPRSGRRAPRSRASSATASTSRSRCPSSPRSSSGSPTCSGARSGTTTRSRDSDRVRAAGGPGWALAYHGAYEFGTPLEDLPGGAEWKAVVERTAPEERHLAVHSAALRRPQRGRRGGLGRGRPPDPRRRDDERHGRSGPRAARGARPTTA